MLGITIQGKGPVTLGKELGKGGEGSVFEVLSLQVPGVGSAQELVAKVYHDPTAGNRREKLKAMISSPVNDPSVAWPQALLLDDSQRFIGYLMVKLQKDSYREWLYVANTKERRRVAPDFDTRYAFMGVRNLAAALLAVHRAGHRQGDINESNIFLGADATVLVVDTDSMQILGRDGTVYPCEVGKPEYTAPELTHGSLRDNPRTEETDIFAFAVAAYQLLSGGATPHQGVFDPHNPNDPPGTVERIRKGVLPNLEPLRAKSFGFGPKPGVPLEAFPPFLLEHLKAFLSPEPSHRNGRYNLRTLLEALDTFIPSLERCSRVKLHWHPRGQECGWCRAAQGGIDPWGEETAPSPGQLQLPPINFQNPQEGGLPKRAAPAVAGPPRTYPQPTYPQQPYVAANNAAYGPPQPQAAPQSQIPKKIRGKIVVEFANGTWGVRPPLEELFLGSSTSRRVFWKAIREETPSFLRAWWTTDRPVVNLLGLGVGVFLGLVLSGAWFAGLYQWLISEPFDFIHLSQNAAFYISLVPFGTAVLGVVGLLLSALKDRRKAAAQNNGSLSGYKQDTPVKSALRFIPVAIFYGLPAILIGLLFFVSVMVQASRSGKL